MPRPAYILCAESAAVDERTKRASYFNVVETITAFRKLPAGAQPKPLFIQVASAWMQTKEDQLGQLFETQIVCTSEGGVELFSSNIEAFTFSTPFHRIQIVDLFIPGFPALGLYIVEAKVRVAGQSDWMTSQSFPFILSEAATHDGSSEHSEADHKP